MIDWHASPFSKLKKPYVRWVGFKDGFQVSWNFLESYQLSDFNEMQSKITWHLNQAFHTRIFG